MGNILGRTLEFEYSGTKDQLIEKIKENVALGGAWGRVSTLDAIHKYRTKNYDGPVIRLWPIYATGTNLLIALLEIQESPKGLKIIVKIGIARHSPLVSLILFPLMVLFFILFAHQNLFRSNAIIHWAAMLAFVFLPWHYQRLYMNASVQYFQALFGNTHDLTQPQ